jgi:long-chain fatty acid transport protein
MRRVLVAALVCAPLTAAHAGGFLAATFGGESGHPTTDDASAIYFNPAGLSLTRGTRLRLEGALIWRLASYDRPTGAIDNPGTGTPNDAIMANSGRASLNNVLVSPFAALVTDFGVKNLGVGVGFGAPFGGQASWNKNPQFAGSSMYPGAVDGVQRWATMDGIIRSTYFMLGASYTIPQIHLSLGLSGNLVWNQISIIRARTATGTDDLVAGSTQLEGRSYLDVSNFTGSIGAGVIWQPASNWWLGVSYQSQPGFGRNTLTGKVQNKLGTAPSATQDVELQQSLPDVLRFGFRVRPIDKIELRLWGEYQRWSVFDKQCVLDPTVVGRNCALTNTGAVDTGGAGIILVLPRKWKDGGSVHGGVSWFTRPWLELQLGLGYDANVVPDGTLDAALIDQDKIFIAAGARFQLVKRKLLVAATYTQVVYITRTAPVRSRDPSAVDPPSRSPDGGGTYAQAVGIFNLALEYNFTGP